MSGSLVSSIEARRGLLVVRLARELGVITTLPHQPSRSNALVFKQVDDGWRGGLKSFYRRVRRGLGLDRAVVFMTSADVGEYIYEVVDDPETHIIATVGLNPPACPASPRRLHEPIHSTINIAVLTSHPLKRSGMLDLLRVVAESKAAAAADALLPCGGRATGTATDAIAVGAPLAARGAVTAGLYTTVGGVVGDSVYRMLVEGATGRMGADERLRALLGLTPDEVIRAFVKVYTTAPIPGVRLEYVEDAARRELEGMLRDPNVAAMLVAARELDIHGAAGSIPGLSRREYLEDSPGIVADELLGSALALYLAGFKGLLATIWVERLKEKGILGGELPVFADDMLSAILGSLVTRIYGRMAKR
ncbi:MAG: adenosylcobinamide amidohydrolase [Aeropyrum sp.]|nr:adenosylcobinamide amidohydrolase [Aeropyrum sp.]MCE4616813.1 adenosylcobinamide amidohydrolase [Aeropyrum sp.]